MRNRGLVLVALSLALAGCKQDNSDYCSATQPCKDATKYCDLDGTYSGTKNNCIASPFDAGPDAHADAHAADASIDAAPCVSSASCPGEYPICGDDGVCRACSTGDDSKCAEHSAATPHCDTSSGLCVQCLGGADCTTATAPICGADHACRACVGGDTCEGHPGTVCDAVSGECVQCVDATNCSGTTPLCLADHTCVACDEGGGITQPLETRGGTLCADKSIEQLGAYSAGTHLGPGQRGDERRREDAKAHPVTWAVSRVRVPPARGPPR